MPAYEYAVLTASGGIYIIQVYQQFVTIYRGIMMIDQPSNLGGAPVAFSRKTKHFIGEGKDKDKLIMDDHRTDKLSILYCNIM